MPSLLLPSSSPDDEVFGAATNDAILGWLNAFNEYRKPPPAPPSMPPPPPVLTATPFLVIGVAVCGALALVFAAMAVWYKARLSKTLKVAAKDGGPAAFVDRREATKLPDTHLKTWESKSKS